MPSIPNQEMPTRERTVWRLRDGVFQMTTDTLVAEEPLEIRVNDVRFAITMRTPGNNPLSDLDLARGLLLTEGVIRSEDDIAAIRHCDTGEDTENVVTAHLHRSVPAGRRWQRTLMSGTSCGLCGKTTIDAVYDSLLEENTIAACDTSVAAETLRKLPDRLREQQEVFSRTGGLHAAALFDTEGTCRAFSEDIGRHNATDRVIGQGVREGWLPGNDPAQMIILLVSGRTSFEITQKAWMAAIPIVCSVSAASALAVELAERSGQTVIGFLRGNGMTVYTGRERIRINDPGERL